MASIRKRNGKWQVQVRRVGSAPVSRTFSKRADGVSWAHGIESHLETSDFRPNHAHKTLTLRDLLARYLAEVTPLKRSPSRERAIIGLFLRHPLADWQLRHINAEAFTKLRDDRLKVVSPATLHRQFNVLRHALRIAREVWEWPSPLDALGRVLLPSVPDYRVERVADAKFRAVLTSARKQTNPYIAHAIELALVTGMRRGELLALSWQDVDIRGRTARLHTTKNGRSRLVPLSDIALDVLQRLPERQGSVLPISENALRLGFQRARKKAGLSMRFHDLRHEAISRLFEAGLTIPEVQLVSGHRTLSQLARYSHGDIGRVARKLSEMVMPS